MLSEFLRYVNLGWQPIPLYQNTKVPINKQWNKNWNLEDNYKKFKYFKDLNMGLLLGEIIDVEGDTQYANDFLDELIGDYEHTVYRSNKSKHHLFRAPGKLSIFKINGMEFRGRGHQSAIPPSSGYTWLCNNLEIKPMPERLLKFYLKNKNKLKPGHVVTTCNQCLNKVYIHKKRLMKECKLLNRWLCRDCR